MAAALCLSGSALAGPPTQFEVPRSRDFAKDLGKNFAGLFSTANIAPLAIGAAATGLSIVPEQSVETYFLANPERADRIAEPGEFIGNAELVSRRCLPDSSQRVSTATATPDLSRRRTPCPKGSW